VRDCYSTGSVTGETYVGGIAGLISGGSDVRYCYTISPVTGNGITLSNAGGIVGIVKSTGVESSVMNCIALNDTITVIGPNIGRIVGANEDTSVLFNHARADMNIFFDGGEDGTDIYSHHLSDSLWWTVDSGFWHNNKAWDALVWNFSDLSENKLPILRNVPGNQNPAKQIISIIPPP
jgi:hypothetical protein